MSTDCPEQTALHSEQACTRAAFALLHLFTVTSFYPPVNVLKKSKLLNANTMGTWTSNSHDKSHHALGERCDFLPLS